MGLTTTTKEVIRARRNKKVRDYVDLILRECESRGFTVADVKDLANLTLYKADKAIARNDEQTNFKVLE